MSTVAEADRRSPSEDRRELPRLNPGRRSSDYKVWMRVHEGNG